MIVFFQSNCNPYFSPTNQQGQTLRPCHDQYFFRLSGCSENVSKNSLLWKNVSQVLYFLCYDFHYILFLLHVWIFASYHHLKIKFSYRPLFCQRQKHQARGDRRGGGHKSGGSFLVEFLLKLFSRKIQDMKSFISMTFIFACASLSLSPTSQPHQSVSKNANF